LPSYNYHAINRQGQAERGLVSAGSASEAVSELEARGLNVQSIFAEQVELEGLSSTFPGARQPMASPGTSTLKRYFDAVIEQRDTMLPALRALVSDLPSSRVKRDMEELVSEVSEARGSDELLHSETAVRWLPLLAAGFSSDATSQRLSDLIRYATRDLQIRTERVRLLTYPILVTLISLIVLALLSLLIVPTFETMFADFGIRLPAPTLLVIEATRQLRFHAIRTLLLIVGTGVLFYVAARLWTRFSLTTRLFGSAVAGNSSAVTAMSSLTGRLAELLQLGVPLADAIWIAGQGCDHYHFRKASEQLATDAHSHVAPLTHSSAAACFPANVIHALEPGPEGPRIGLLRELSSMYAGRVHRRVDWVTGAIAQLSIVVLGVLIAFVVVALLMPLLSLITSLS
jgi:type II secretory pathway component PulF